MATNNVNISDSAQSRAILVKTADHALDRNDCPCLISNAGATGAVTITLPQDAKGGEIVEAVCEASQSLRLDPGAAGAIIAHDGTSYGKQIDDKYIAGATAGHRIKLMANGDGDWLALDQDNGAGAIGFNTVES